LRRFSKIAAVALVASMTLAGCGKDDSSGSDSAAEGCKAGGDGSKVGIAYDVGGRGDRSFNDSAWAGMEKAIKDLDASCTEAKAAAGENDTQREERLRTLADQGFNPVVAVGFIYSPAAAKVAAEFPDTNFAVIDGYSQFLTGDEQLKNLVDLTFAEEQGSYLVGVAAALKSKAKHVGFVGGTHGDLIKKFEAGYVAGVKSVDPSIKIEVKYLTEDPNDGKTGFENPSGGKLAAEGQLDKGADVIYHAAGKSGNGVFEAVEAAGEGNMAIGVDSDQYLTASESQKPFILTSMLKRIDTAVFDYIKANDDGKSPSGNVTYDLASDGVGYSTSGGFVDDIKDQIDAAAEQIKSGEVKVPTAPAN
jgi:basic membrane protein A